MANDAEMTTAEELARVKTQIREVMRKQSYSITTGGGNRSITRGNLDTLIRREAYLMTKLEREGNGGVGIEYTC